MIYASSRLTYVSYMLMSLQFSVEIQNIFFFLYQPTHQPLYLQCLSFRVSYKISRGFVRTKDSPNSPSPTSSVFPPRQVLITKAFARWSNTFLHFLAISLCLRMGCPRTQICKNTSKWTKTCTNIHRKYKQIITFV